MKRKKLSASGFRITVIVFILIFIIGSILFGMFAQNQVQLKKQRAIADIESQGNKAQFVIETTLQKLDTLKVFVQLSHGEMELFEETAKLIVEDEKVRNIALAPNGVMKDIYPLKGNEKAVGLDLLGEKNASRAEAKLAVETHQMTIAGPYELTQGGRAITGRLPLYLPKNNGGTEEFWGFATITLDMENVLAQINMESLTQSGYAYQLYHIDPNDNSLQVIAAGDEAVRRSHVEAKLPLLNDVWYLRAAPVSGWFPASYIILFLVICFVFDALICSLLYLLLYLRDDWKEKASRDSLTHLYNHQSMETIGRELLQQHLPKQFAYMIIDIDNFKQINDTLGHHVGDEVLIMLANILEQRCGADALIGRPGGDEFSLLVSYKETSEAVAELAMGICSTLKRRIEKNGTSADISCSIGISLFPEHADNWMDLRIQADKALYYCKEREKGSFRIYDESCMEKDK